MLLTACGEQGNVTPYSSSTSKPSKPQATPSKSPGTRVLGAPGGGPADISTDDTQSVFSPSESVAVVNCPSSASFCLYRDEDFGGPVFKTSLTGPGEGFKFEDFGGMIFDDETALNDQVSSLINNTDQCLRLFTNAGANGSDSAATFVVPPHTASAWVAESRQVFKFNDAASSLALEQCN
ncbi:peptidase inhibitor family I36 protein [Streptomyces flaveolus]|uniref:peptidase inhibitor family I36 protein n=1 Tax=Streptomyces flaveolus TaxID=67297 RepID=UPI0033DC7FEA